MPVACRTRHRRLGATAEPATEGPVHSATLSQRRVATCLATGTPRTFAVRQFFSTRPAACRMFWSLFSLASSVAMSDMSSG
jgi:hypothetical protein